MDIVLYCCKCTFGTSAPPLPSLLRTINKATGRTLDAARLGCDFLGERRFKSAPAWWKAFGDLFLQDLTTSSLTSR